MYHQVLDGDLYSIFGVVLFAHNRAVLLVSNPGFADHLIGFTTHSLYRDFQ
jgi:hypothetical protein